MGAYQAVDKSAKIAEEQAHLNKEHVCLEKVEKPNLFKPQVRFDENGKFIGRK